MITAIWPSEPGLSLLVLESRTAILELAPLLEKLAERCGQSGAMHWLPYFLDESTTRNKAPLLVLVLRLQELPARGLSEDDLQAAALFSEYRLWGCRTGAVVTDDAVGFRTVIAPEGERTRMAALAARALMNRGADVVLATFEAETEPNPRHLVSGWRGVVWAERKRVVGRMLTLEPTFDATLARMGKSTRFNLRYYRRRLVKQVAVQFLAEAGPLLRQDELERINAGSLNPVLLPEFLRRVRSASSLPGSFLMGLRGPGGQWLSLMGGWRQGTASVLHWQMNAAGWEKHSIGTVMRSFLLEHEIAIGARTLMIHGGTAHTMRHAFEPASVTDLVVKRRSLRAFLLQRSARFFASTRGVTGPPNYLAEVLRSPELHWAKCPSLPPRESAPGLLPRPVDLHKARSRPGDRYGAGVST